MNQRIEKLEQQVADLFSMLEVNGIHLIKCDFCGKVLPCHAITIPGLEGLTHLNGVGIPGVALRDGKYTRYYCVEHLVEAYEDCQEWDGPDAEHAEYTIAYWLLKYKLPVPEGRKRLPIHTPERTMSLLNYPEIKDKAVLLAP